MTSVFLCGYLSKIFLAIILKWLVDFKLNLSVTSTVICLTQADRSGPNFSSVYKNTEQMVNVSSCFTSYFIYFWAGGMPAYRGFGWEPLVDPCNLSFSLCVFIVHITCIIQNIGLFSFLKTIFHGWSLHIVLSRWVSTLWTSYCTVRLCCQRSTSCLLRCRLETPTERSDLQQRTRCWPRSQVSVNKNAP